LVHLNKDGTLTGYHKAGGGTLFTTASGFDPTGVDPVYLGVEVLGNSLRAFVGSDDVTLFDGAPVNEAFVTCSTCRDAGHVGAVADQAGGVANTRTFDDIRIVELD
ncbi:MAG: hypothetical protein AAFY88_23915, partial [Acidobacteriota bacterium]